jgi:hypothetical protein
LEAAQLELPSDLNPPQIDEAIDVEGAFEGEASRAQACGVQGALAFGVQVAQDSQGALVIFFCLMASACFG